MDKKHIWPSMSSSSNLSSNAKERRTRNWLDLPCEVTARILMKLGAFEILNSTQQVCTLWRSICRYAVMWRTIDMRDLGIRKHEDYNLNKMCCHAINRSCGLLVELNVEYFCNNYLLKHLAYSTCHHLRCLRLAQCYFVVLDEGLIEVARKFPLLEELEITLCHVSSFALGAVGRCCPHLKSLKFHPCLSEGNEEAFVIAQTMPELRHLRLFKSKLNNGGLLAILDGCPRLESLDLRRCSNVNLEGSLGERCAEQIKDLRHHCRFEAALNYYERTHEDCSLEYIFRRRQPAPFNVGVPFYEEQDENEEQDELWEELPLPEYEEIKWEETRRAWELEKMIGLSLPNEIDAVWTIAKSRRYRKGKKNTNSKGFPRFRKGKKNTRFKGKKRGRKGGKINRKSICFEKELW